MKKLLISLVLLIFNLNTGYAQAPINVEITGECDPASGTYTFNGLLNGKNNYVRTIIIDGETIVVGVGFDGTKWVLYANNDLTDPGFDNIAVPNESLPPFIGWVQNGCFDGTMIITQSLNSLQIDYSSEIVTLFPNPSPSYVMIENKQGSNDIFNYKIYDLTGRVVTENKSNFNEMLLIDYLTAGTYVIEIRFKNGMSVTKRLIKN